MEMNIERKIYTFVMSIGPHGCVGCEVSSGDWPGLQRSCLCRRRTFSAVSSRLLSKIFWTPNKWKGINFNQTSSSNCRSRLSWVSSWRLCSSSIFIRASNRVLCCLNKRASANISLSTSDEWLPDDEAPPWCGMGVASSGEEENEKDMEGDCCERSLSYSAWSVAFSSSSSLRLKTTSYEIAI